MSLKSIMGFFEYPDVPDLGIKGSDKNNLVPSDLLIVKSNQVIDAGVEVVSEVIVSAKDTATALRTAAGEILTNFGEKLSGNVETNKQAGTVFKSVPGD